MGSVQPFTGGNSIYAPDGSILNRTDGYWWSAYTESPGCTKSADAPAWLLNMDWSPPPKPVSPTCTLDSQDLVSGFCTFSCSWPADLETDNSCSGATADEINYHPVFGTSPGSSDLSDPGWVAGTQLTATLNNVADGQLVYTQLTARDALGNTSAASDTGGPFTCPCIVGGSCGPTPTPTPTGEPTPIPSLTPTPSITPSPTVAATPTPGGWMQVQGGDVYQGSISQTDLPASQYFLTYITPTPPNPQSAGVIRWSDTGGLSPGSGYLSPRQPNDWKVKGTLTNTYNFTFYWEALKNKAITVNNITVGDSGYYSSTPNNAIYSYPGGGHFTLSPSFSPNPNTDVTIFIITGTFEITQNFTSSKPVVFIVNGHIFIDGGVERIPGLYITGCENPPTCGGGTFTIDTGSNKIIIDGMVYAYKFNLNRTYKSFTAPAYQFIYQPKYMIALLPYLGRPQINWQEVGP
ncbi:hypothetical protein HY950_04000 [Candidatus Gottesmanbacteria bacterium]|nr:hypothetical protein [Candidatus Gottesmanbacteria bacterium]